MGWGVRVLGLGVRVVGWGRFLDRVELRHGQTNGRREGSFIGGGG